MERNRICKCRVQVRVAYRYVQRVGKAWGGVEVAAVRARYAARIRGLQLVVIPEFVHEYQRRIHREIIPVDYYVIVFDVGYLTAVALDAKALGFVNRFFSGAIPPVP